MESVTHVLFQEEKYFYLDFVELDEQRYAAVTKKFDCAVKQGLDLY